MINKVHTTIIIEGWTWTNTIKLGRKKDSKYKMQKRMHFKSKVKEENTKGQKIRKLSKDKMLVSTFYNLFNSLTHNGKSAWLFLVCLHILITLFAFYMQFSSMFFCPKIYFDHKQKHSIHSRRNLLVLRLNEVIFRNREKE